MSKSETNSKFQIQNSKSAGFTLIELMVAISITAILATIMVINLAGQRRPRDLKIAQTQLVSDIRQIQSATLSSRLLPNGEEAQYYFIKFSLAQPTQYTIEAIYNSDTSPQLVDLQVVSLPPNIRFAAPNPGAGIYPIKITGRQTTPAEQDLSAPTDCGLLSFSAPFGKPLLNLGCGLSSPPLVYNGDDYYNIMNFITNLNCDGLTPACNTSADSMMIMTLSDADGKIFKTVTLNGITGAVTFN